MRTPSLIACVILLLTAPAHSATVSYLFRSRIYCAPHASGVQFCQSVETPVGQRNRVESWDGVPLDVAVTLPPAAMDGPFPLIVQLHGWSLARSQTPFVAEAMAGYAVLSFTARGFHQSCGLAASRASDPSLGNPDVCGERGWTRLADARYEIRDTQYLAGVLADEGIVIPDRIGVTGVSYGGGQSFTLAVLRNRVMLPDGTLVPWKSPGGLDMAIAAAAPLIGWTDLVEALTPAGRMLDYRTDNPSGTRGGVQKQSWNMLLFGLGRATGYYAPAGADPEADLTKWNTRLVEGEPYDDDPTLVGARAEITAHHSAYYIDDAVTPAPLFIYNSWTDDLFPVDEALRLYRKIRAHHPDAEVALHFEAGFGHWRAALDGDLTRVNTRVAEHFARFLKGTGAALPSIETFTQACAGATEAGPFTAADWDALRPGEVRFRARGRRRFFGGAGDTDVAKVEDPLNADPCPTIAAKDDPGAVTFKFGPVRGDGFTLMGAPTVIARLTVHGHFAQVVARLWDLSPDGMQTLVTHAIYRPRSDNRNPQPFQLHANGWHFAAGHRVKLDLVGGSVPYGRLKPGKWFVVVRGVQLRLPVVDRPGGVIRARARGVLPPAAVEPPDTGM